MSRLLVGLQFLLIVALAWPTLPIAFSTLTVSGVLLGALGLALFAWSYFSMPTHTFSVMPEPRTGASLARNGPYAYVRHPMYSSLMLCAVGAAMLYSAQPWKWLAVLALLCLLIVKLHREEQWLTQKYADYAQYKMRTEALLPFIW